MYTFFLNLALFFEGLDVFIFHFERARQDNPIKCRIRVGPRRFIEQPLYSDKCVVDLVCNNFSTHIHGQAVQFERKGDTVIFDAVEFLKANKAEFTYCNSDSYSLRKKFSSYYRDVESGEYGLYAYESYWADCDCYHSSLFLRDGAFFVNDRPLYYASWSALSSDFALFCRDQIVSFLNKPHSITVSDLMQFLTTESASYLDRIDLGFSDCSISIRPNHSKGSISYIIEYGCISLNETVTIHSLDTLFALLSYPDSEEALRITQMVD